MSYKKLGEPGQLPQSKLGSPVQMQPYSNKILRTRPGNLIQYLMVDEPLEVPAVAVAIDSSPEENDGAYTAVTLGQPGIGDGRTAGVFDGATSFLNSYSGAFNADFDGQEFTIFGWGKVSSAGVWVDATERRLRRLLVDGNNRITVRKSTVNDQLDFLYAAGGTLKVISSVSLAATLGCFSWAGTVSLVADEMKFYLNGVQVGATLTGLGTWVGALDAAQTIIGAASTIPVQVWLGTIAHNPTWNAALNADEILELSVR